MPYLEGNIRAVLSESAEGMTADDLSDVVFAPMGRVRATLRRLMDAGVVRIVGGSGAATRYAMVGAGTRTRPGDSRGFGGAAAGGASGRWGPGFSGSRHAGETSTAGVADMVAELRRLRAEVQSLRRENQDLRRALGRVQRASAGATVPGAAERVEMLLRLCHPDRHDNSEQANEVTRWLLGLRRR